MPIQVSCPACRMTLNVPDHLLGKRVKCPECATPFDARPEGAAPTVPPTQSLVPPTPADLPPPVPSSTYRPNYEPEPWDDSYGRSDGALSKVQAPAIILMILCGLGLLGSFAMFALFVLVLAEPPGPNNQGDVVAGAVFLLGFGLAYAVYNGLILYGANEMRTLRSYGWAMASCILSIVGGSCLGIPVAVWGLVVINDAEVKRAFANNRAKRG